MDMSTTTSMTMSMTSTASMAMSTSMDHSSHDMSSMDMEMDAAGHMMMSMKDMMMTFFTSTSTPLYSESWTPTTSGQYVATCIFLIALAAIFRGIIAVRTNFPVLLAAWSYRRDTNLLRRDMAEDSIKLTPNGGISKRPWNINESLARAMLDTILAGVSYLLMLAVMTMNVGYFMSILGGTFLGSFVLGDWTPSAAMHCDAH